MPATLAFPGVYIEEIQSGVHTITGVATSITAFVGRAARGPVNQATTVTSFADFQRNFGSPSPSHMLGYAVNDFYRNGGSQAIIVRVYKTAGVAAATLNPGGLPLKAASEGSWANNLVATILLDGNAAAAQRLGVTVSDLFTLKITDNGTGVTETYHDLTVIASANRFDRVLAGASSLVLSNVADPYVPPAMPTAAAGVGPAIAAAPEIAPDANTFINQGPKKGLFALEDADLFNMLCIPPYDTDNIDMAGLAGAVTDLCTRRRAMWILDSPTTWTTPQKAAAGKNANDLVTSSTNAAVFFPRYTRPNADGVAVFPPCGAVAGVFARTDSERGVWKAPAGISAAILGAQALSVHLTDAENGLLNPLGVNCLRDMLGSRVVWGSRTLQGDDRLTSQWKYIPVRRTALYIEESLYRGTQWVVFEPNDEPLWAQIRLNVGAFLHGMFRQGAFQGATPAEAYFVKCDKDTTTQTDINSGVVNIIVGFEPLKPAEFVIISLQQIAGSIAA